MDFKYENAGLGKLGNEFSEINFACKRSLMVAKGGFHVMDMAPDAPRADAI